MNKYIYNSPIYNDKEQVLTVADFLGVINMQLRNYNVTVQGEITGGVNRRGKVTYFSLHDNEENAVMQCMGFNSILYKLGIELKQGMSIQVNGFPEIWARTGNFAFKVFGIQLLGQGSLTRQFEAMRLKLEREGLFNLEYKKRLPSYIKSIGLITSVGREAETDFVTHLSAHDISVKLYDVRVEGPQAIEQIVGAIKWFNEYSPDTQVLVLTRGGGALENLQAFNSEDVARAIFASRIPIICGVGHEKDVTISDMVCDVRASTPTHAGRIISEDWDRADDLLIGMINNLTSSFNTIVVNNEVRLKQFKVGIQSSMNISIDNIQSKIKLHNSKLNLSNPELKLKQGYSITVDKKGKIIKKINQVKVGDFIKTRISDGVFNSNISTS